MLTPKHTIVRSISDVKFCKDSFFLINMYYLKFFSLLFVSFDLFYTVNPSHP